MGASRVGDTLRNKNWSGEDKVKHTQKRQSFQSTEKGREESNMDEQLWRQKDEKDEAIKPGDLPQNHDSQENKSTWDCLTSL